jgi:hypothetical protein
MALGLGALLSMWLVASPAAPAAGNWDPEDLTIAPEARLEQSPYAWYLVDVPGDGMEGIDGSPRGFFLQLDGRRTARLERVAWRFGLPVDAGPQWNGVGVVVDFIGARHLRAGTVGQLWLEGRNVREVAGQHVVRIDPVPGLWLQIAPDSPFEAGAGWLPRLEHEDGALAARVRAVLVQFSFRM